MNLVNGAFWKYGGAREAFQLTVQVSVSVLSGCELGVLSPQMLHSKYGMDTVRFWRGAGAVPFPHQQH
jgi:hypothetical protein